jgi:hypothetical protein
MQVIARFSYRAERGIACHHPRKGYGFLGFEFHDL